MHEYLFPAAEMDMGTEADQKALQEKLASLSCKWPEDDGSGRAAEGIFKNKDFTIYARETGDMLYIRLKDADTELELTAGKDRPGLFAMNPGLFSETATTWAAQYGCKEGKLHLVARNLNGPQRLDAQVTCADGKIEVDTSRSLCFIQYTGVLEKE